MNPAKVNKMDEEVQKWSRKDPMAIKKGMLLPRKSITSITMFNFHSPKLMIKLKYKTYAYLL